MTSTAQEKCSTQAAATSRPSGSPPAATQRDATSAATSGTRSGSQSQGAYGTRRVGAEQSRDFLAAVALGLALASTEAREGLRKADPTVWKSAEAAILAAVLAGDAEAVAKELSAYGVDRQSGERITLAIVRRISDMAADMSAAAFRWRVQHMAQVSEPKAFEAWLKGEMAKRVEG